uniref:Uncharacterized protein n=1 Tax=Panagrolaimus superbus TaxID=310955 RepID=A0A914YV40_9BILA
MSIFTNKFDDLRIAVEDETISFEKFLIYFNGFSDSHLNLLQVLHWFERYVQDIWEKSNFTFIDVNKELEDLIESIYTVLPFDDSGTVWFGGIIPSKNENNGSLSCIKTSFFSIYLIVAASSGSFLAENSLFIAKMYDRLFYHVPTPVSFCEAFMENDTRLISSMLAFLFVDKNHPGLSANYKFVDLFVALILQFHGDAGNVFVEFLATETVMIPFILRTFKYLNGKLQILKESYERLKNQDNRKLLQNERTLFKRSSESSSQMVFNIDGINGSHRITIDKRTESKDVAVIIKDNNFDIVKFFHDFYELVLDAHKKNRFPFKSDALVKCLHNFDCYITKA